MGLIDFGAGFLVGLAGRSLLSKLFKTVGSAVKGIYHVVMDATRRQFNSDVQRSDFNFRNTIEEDSRKYKNAVTLRTWFKKYAKEHRYRGLLIQGHLYCFTYDDPVTKDKLEYYDTTPLVLSFGVYYAETGNIVERGINLHFLPMDVRKALLLDIFNAFKDRYKGKMYSSKPRSINELDWEFLKQYIVKYGIDFAVRSYISDRRRNTIIFGYEDWGKAICIPSSKFVGIDDRALQRRYKAHLVDLKRKQ